MPDAARSLVEVADAIRGRTACSRCIVETTRLVEGTVISALAQLTTMGQTYARQGRCYACNDEQLVYRLHGT